MQIFKKNLLRNTRFRFPMRPIHKYKPFMRNVSPHLDSHMNSPITPERQEERFYDKAGYHLWNHRINQRDKKNEPIVIHETPEMANWIHPQTPERKARLEKQGERTKRYFRNYCAFKRLEKKIEAQEFEGFSSIHILLLNTKAKVYPNSVLRNPFLDGSPLYSKISKGSKTMNMPHHEWPMKKNEIRMAQHREQMEKIREERKAERGFGISD